MNFPIEGTPIQDDAYLIIRAENVSQATHRITINNTELPNFDLPVHSGWQSWVDHIPPGALQSGNNRIHIERVGNDDFDVAAVVVHWREATIGLAG
jgi:hypothetical protein